MYLGALGTIGGDLEDAENWYRRAHAASHGSVDQAARSRAAWGLALIRFNRREYAQVVSELDPELSSLRRLRDRALVADVLRTLGTAYEKLGQGEPASALYTESLTVATEMGDDSRCALAMRQLGGRHYLEGDLVSAQRYWSDSLDMFRRRKDARGVAMMAFWLGVLAGRNGDLDKALLLIGESHAIYQRIGPADLATRAQRAIDEITTEVTRST